MWRIRKGSNPLSTIHMRNKFLYMFHTSNKIRYIKFCI
nr:MAG TPA: hypothetical protein [Caudoviricetes sp.]